MIRRANKICLHPIHFPVSKKIKLVSTLKKSFTKPTGEGVYFLAISVDISQGKGTLLAILVKEMSILVIPVKKAIFLFWSRECENLALMVLLMQKLV